MAFLSETAVGHAPVHKIPARERALPFMLGLSHEVTHAL